MLLGILLGLLVLASIGCCIFKDLLYVAISLATVSAILALVLFLFHANTAGVFELSVCAGLITVLFVSTVSLTKDSDRKVESRSAGYFVVLFVLIFIGMDFYIMKWLSQSLLPATAPQSAGTFQKIFWEVRSADVLGQLALIMAGVFGILALFRLKKEKKHD
jgi:NADH-quinone oxidoreductase subunit J